MKKFIIIMLSLISMILFAYTWLTSGLKTALLVGFVAIVVNALALLYAKWVVFVDRNYMKK